MSDRPFIPPPSLRPIAVAAMTAAALVSCAGARGAAPEVRIAPAPRASPEPLAPAGPRLSVSDCFAAAVARANQRCELSVHENEAMDPEASSSRVFCFDGGKRPVMLERKWGSDAGGGSQTFVLEGSRLYAAREVDSPPSGAETERTFCGDAGGEEFADEVRSLGDGEIGALVATALQELRHLELPEPDADGKCSDHPEFDSVCYGPDFCYTPSRSVEVSPELCGKADELLARLEAIAPPD